MLSHTSLLPRTHTGTCTLCLPPREAETPGSLQGRRYPKKCLVLNASHWLKGLTSIYQNCLLKLWIINVKSREKPSTKWTCRQTSMSQPSSPASPSPLASACLLLLLNFTSVQTVCYERYLLSPQVSCIFLSSSRP